MSITADQCRNLLEPYFQQFGELEDENNSDKKDATQAGGDGGWPSKSHKRSEMEGGLFIPIAR